MKVRDLALLALFVLPGLGLAQDGGEEKRQDNDPEIKTAVADLEKAYKDKDDGAAKAKMRELLDRLPQAGPKDSDKIVKSFGKAYSQRRDDKDLFVAATAVLGASGLAGSPELQKAYVHKAFKKDPEMLRMILVELGRCVDPKAVSFLADQLDFKFYEVTAGAAEGMAHYSGAVLEIRKQLVEPLVKTLESAANAANDLNNTQARQRYGVIGAPLIDALQKLTGQSLRDPLDWTKWWNDNKKAKDW